MTTKEFHRLVIQTRGIQENNHFFTSLFEHRVGINDEDFLVVLEAVEKEEGNKFFEETLLRVLKLYNAGDIYSCYFSCKSSHTADSESRHSHIRTQRYRAASPPQWHTPL